MDSTPVNCGEEKRYQLTAAVTRFIKWKVKNRYRYTRYVTFTPLFCPQAAPTAHPKCSIIFEALKPKGFDVIKLKRSIAIGVLKHRAIAYSVIYDGLRQRRNGADHFFSPWQQTSTRATVAYAHARFSTVPGADLVIDPDWPMDTG